MNTRVEAFEVDFHRPDLALCAEVDGPGHARPRTRREDRARDRALRASGREVLRFTEADLAARPDHVIARLTTPSGPAA